MTRIVTSSYRYQRPRGRKKPVAIEGPAVITTATMRFVTNLAGVAISVVLLPVRQSLGEPHEAPF
jgi:hypothetical protein